MISRKYTAAFKIKMVEQYLEENAKKKLPKSEFAARNGLSDSTFNDWVIKYKRQENGFCNITGEIIKLNDIEVISPEDLPVRIYQADSEKSIDPDHVKMTYNGASIVFHVSLLERVMEILRQW